MRKLLLGISLTLVASLSFAGKNQKNTIMDYIYFDDFKTWLTGGESLYSWSIYVDRDKTISKQVYEPPVMYHEFDSNVYAASKKYNSVPTLLNGVVQSVKSDSANKPVVTFSAGSSDYFYAKGFEVDEVSKLKRGSQFTFVCINFDYDGLILRSNQCTTTSNYYDLLSVGLFKDVDVKKIELNSPYQFKDLLLKNMSKDEINKFNQECSYMAINDTECLSKANEITMKALREIAK
ncbi:hypothetical protein AVENLUH5627_02786 [Acinetobacter venetianus]|uniref:tRNA_anti-like protein n=1 Tax=Acinetobacter venetianus TaxID=52133 RepID=A0A150HL48_9GAMM|nr:hypothetical protein [Acinetobacter venetianus]KXZ65496.1 hypothetical protein AVENLUH5627_02786 [Acinetobacter venetianus]